MSLLTPTTTETVSGLFIDLANPDPEKILIEDIAWALSRQARYAGHSMFKTPFTVAQHTVNVSRYVEEALTPGTALYVVFRRYIKNHLEITSLKGDGPTNQQFVTWCAFDEISRGIDDSLRKSYAFHGLMHDFAEAYLIDLPTPVKMLPGVYEAYKKYELQMDEIIYKKFELAYSPTKFPATWQFGLMVVKWADMYALAIEAWHLMPSRGVGWNIAIEKPTLDAIEAFQPPMVHAMARWTLLTRFDQLKPVKYED